MKRILSFILVVTLLFSVTTIRFMGHLPGIGFIIIAGFIRMRIVGFINLVS